MAAKSSPSRKPPFQRVAKWQSPQAESEACRSDLRLGQPRPGGETEAERGVPGSEEETGRRSRPGRRNRQPFYSGRTDRSGSQHEEERRRSGQDLAGDDQESPRSRSAKALELVPRPHPGFWAQ